MCRLWCNWLILLVFYLVWVLFFEFGFIEDFCGVFFIVDMIVNGFFVIDIILIFFVVYFDLEMYLMVDSFRKIVKR